MGYSLQPPKGHQGSFYWPDYLATVGASAVSTESFVELFGPAPDTNTDVYTDMSSDADTFAGVDTKDSIDTKDKQQIQVQSLFEAAGLNVGNALEAVDRVTAGDPPLICVANIAAINYQVVPPLLLIHFDGWSNQYDYWTDVWSKDLRPVGFCRNTGLQLQRPPNHYFPEDTEEFSWTRYLAAKNAMAAPEGIFQIGSPIRTTLQADLRNIVATANMRTALDQFVDAVTNFSSQYVALCQARWGLLCSTLSDLSAMIPAAHSTGTVAAHTVLAS